MNKIFNAIGREEIFLAVAIVFLAMPVVSRGEAYLRAFGPPPLRFAYVDNNNAVFLAELALPKANPVEEPTMPAPQAEATNNVPNATVATPSTTLNGTPLLPMSGNNLPAGGRPASDMLSLTPEMISDYFKPIRAEGGADPESFQPGETIFVPAELGFVPPGSRASYISK